MDARLTTAERLAWRLLGVVLALALFAWGIRMISEVIAHVFLLLCIATIALWIAEAFIYWRR